MKLSPIYTKTHTSKKAVKDHASKIIKRGGFVKQTKKGNKTVLEYSFSKNN